MKPIFLSFADKTLHRSARRISSQAKNMDLFNRIEITNERNLDAQFQLKFADKLRKHVKGFGYWCWKPKIILSKLKKMNEGDTLVYCDVGCHLNPNGRTRMLDYFQTVNKSEVGILTFKAITPNLRQHKIPEPKVAIDQPNKHWIKADTLNHFGLLNDNDFLEDQAVGAGIILIRKTKKSVEIIEEWMQIFEQNFSLVDDTLSKKANLPCFKEHRHDQAILTILSHKYNIPHLSSYEYFYPKVINNDVWIPDWKILSKHPIHAKRDLHDGSMKAHVKNSLRYVGLL
jgi:hypothetical protein